MELDKSWGSWKYGTSLLDDVAYSLYLTYRKNNIKPNYAPYTTQELFIFFGSNVYKNYYYQSELIIRREKILQLKSKNDKSKIE